MALVDDAVYTAAQGFIFTAPVDTEAPTVAEIDAFSPGTPELVGWENIGHTARDELPVFGYEGGDVEARGTWQNATLRTVQTEAASDYVTFNVHQFDKANMEFYYGQESANTDPNIYSVESSSTAAVQRALLIVIVDGTVRIGFHAPKTDIRREDSIELAVDEFAYMPLRATIVKSSNSPYLFSWINVNAPVVGS